MSNLDILSELKHLGVRSSIVDIDFLIEAGKGGTARDEELAPAVKLLADEFGRDWISDTVKSFFRELDLEGLFTGGVLFSRQAANRPEVEESMIKANLALDSLSFIYPEAAEAYRPLLEKAMEAMAAKDGADWEKKAEENFSLLTKTIERELALQEARERHFWNGVRIAALARIDTGSAANLLSAHEFIGSLSKKQDAAPGATSLESEAAGFQLPILSKAVAQALKEAGAEVHILQIGEKTVVKTDKDGLPMILDTPGFAKLGVPILAGGVKSPGDSVVSIPVSSRQLGRTRWTELASSPLFSPHDTTAVPSSRIFGAVFPKQLPAKEEIELIVAGAFPEPGEGVRVSAMLGGIERDGSYLVMMRSELMRHGMWSETASLSLKVTNGSISEAYYMFPGLPGGYALKVVLDPGRLGRLVAKGKADSFGSPFSDTVEAQAPKETPNRSKAGEPESKGAGKASAKRTPGKRGRKASASQNAVPNAATQLPTAKGVK